MNLSQRIRKLRQEKKMTMKEIAQHLGVPTSTYRDWEYGSKIPADAVVQIAQLFNSSPNELLGMEKLQNKNLWEAIHLIEEGLKLLRIP